MLIMMLLVGWAVCAVLFIGGAGWASHEANRIYRQSERTKVLERPNYVPGVWCKCHPPLGLHPVTAAPVSAEAYSF